MSDSRPGADLESAVRTLLSEIGEDPTREGLARTPDGCGRMYDELTAGYHVDPERAVNGACFDVDYDEMVVVRDIEFYSLCEHHLLPFIGTAHVGYLPKGRVIGLSKIPRIVDMYAQRLQVQERLTVQVADFLMERLTPKGVGVRRGGIPPVHDDARRAEAGGAHGHIAMLGTFRRDARTRGEFMGLIGKGGST